MIDSDKNIAVHKKYIIKEMRVMIYSLFLESYKTVTLDCMAAEFGVSANFLDK
jgi:26S proteasome regulatory subunit N7